MKYTLTVRERTAGAAAAIHFFYRGYRKRTGRLVTRDDAKETFCDEL